jgi:hypothetical protein
MLADLNGSNGFVVNGIVINDNTGHSVSGAGDINGDSFDDIIIGANLASPNATTRYAGQSSVIFGGATVGNTGVIELSDLNGTNGFIFNGIDYMDYSGKSVKGAGDWNGDNIDDIIIGAASADPLGIRLAGESYVIFGKEQIGNTGRFELSDLDGTNGVVFQGIHSFDLSGASVSGAGDVNGDHYDDIIIGAPGAETSLKKSSAGASYLVFGKAPYSFSSRPTVAKVGSNAVLFAWNHQNIASSIMSQAQIFNNARGSSFSQQQVSGGISDQQQAGSMLSTVMVGGWMMLSFVFGRFFA